jgi:hypothetical protein
MSILFDAVIAEPMDAPAIMKAEDLSPWSGQSLSIGDEDSLAELWAVLENRPYNVDDTLRFKTLARQEDGSTWMVLVPEPLVSALAGLAESQLPTIAGRWRELAKLREPRLYGPAFDDNLAKLRSQALRAKRAKKPLLIMVTV